MDKIKRFVIFGHGVIDPFVKPTLDLNEYKKFIFHNAINSEEIGCKLVALENPINNTCKRDYRTSNFYVFDPTTKTTKWKIDTHSTTYLTPDNKIYNVKILPYESNDINWRHTGIFICDNSTTGNNTQILDLRKYPDGLYLNSILNIINIIEPNLDAYLVDLMYCLELDPYAKKYLKYKTKYLELKKNNIFTQ